MHSSTSIIADPIRASTNGFQEPRPTTTERTLARLSLALSWADYITTIAGLLPLTLNVTDGTLTLAQITNLSFTVGDGSADGTMTCCKSSSNTLVHSRWRDPEVPAIVPASASKRWCWRGRSD